MPLTASCAYNLARMPITPPGPIPALAGSAERPSLHLSIPAPGRVPANTPNAVWRPFIRRMAVHHIPQAQGSFSRYHLPIPGRKAPPLSWQSGACHVPLHRDRAAPFPLSLPGRKAPVRHCQISFKAFPPSTQFYKITKIQICLFHGLRQKHHYPTQRSLCYILSKP